MNGGSADGERQPRLTDPRMDPSLGPMRKSLNFRPGKRIDLDRIDPADTGKYRDREQAEAEENRYLKRLYDLQARFAAESKRGLLIVLQGLDAAGKDGTIRHVFTGMNPQGCDVHAFKVPTPIEAAHDYLWRIHVCAPRKGMIGIFNRSHYEDVLAVRVLKLVPPEVWGRRYDQINEFERMLTENGTVILKFYLHISAKEQRQRILDRLSDPLRNWKFSESDLETRRKWKLYRAAYNDALTRCNTEWAPWHVVPADRKWYRNLLISQTVTRTLEEMKPKVPRPKLDLKRYRAELK